MNEKELELAKKFIMPMTDILGDAARKVYDEVFNECKSDRMSQSVLLNSFALAYAKTIAIFLHAYSDQPIQDALDEIYRRIQKFASDLLAERSNGHTSFMIELPREEEKNPG